MRRRSGVPQSVRQLLVRPALCLGASLLLHQAGAGQSALLAQSATDLYKQAVVYQSGADPLIGVWYGSACGKRIVLAVVLNEHPTPENREFKLKKLVLNGGELGHGYRDADVVGYLSPLKSPGVYEGVAGYRLKAADQWFPQRAFLVEPNVLKTFDDVGSMPSCNKGESVFLRSATPAGPSTEGPVERLRGSGSGFLLRHTALVMTARHVVDGATSIEAIFQSGQSYTARIVAMDSANDLAILELEDFGASDRGFDVEAMSPVVPGQSVSALGYPKTGMLGTRPSIVSGEINADVGMNGSPTQFRTNAPVNSGNSGGPVIGADGRVLGVVISRAGDDAEAVHFAAKMTAALPLLQLVGWRPAAGDASGRLSPDKLFAKYADDVPLILVESLQAKKE
jgi:S1-C subfamily serine protease